MMPRRDGRRSGRAAGAIVAALALLAGLAAFGSDAFEPAAAEKIIRPHFSRHGARGTFLLHDLNQDSTTCIDPDLCSGRYLPASTFKIFNALVGLETGVIDDEMFVIPWDGIERRVAGWNEDQDLATAMKRSTVPYFQEVAHRIGADRMQHYLDAVGYGNADMSGGDDPFWLRGNLRISPAEQIEFLIRLYRGDLPFSDRSMEIVKKIILLEESAGSVLRGKTGWTVQDGLQVGWLVGWVERDEDAYFFASLILSEDPGFDMREKRDRITYGILNDFGLISRQDR